MYSLEYHTNTDDQNDKVYYICKEEYTVGRKDSDLMIERDPFISRKHAVFTVKNENLLKNLYITSLKTNLKTFINETLVKADLPMKLKVGDIIRFGEVHKYRVVFDPLIVISSGITKPDQVLLDKYLLELKTKTISTWSQSCNYLTVNEIVLSVKVICGIVMGQPIVTLDFWPEYVKCVKENKPKPKVEDFKPKINKKIIRNDISFDYSPDRRTVLTGKVFIFPEKKAMDSMKELILLAGGQTELISESNFSNYTNTTQNSNNQQYIIVSSTLSTNTSFYNRLIESLTNTGQRTIPLQEIPLSIIYGSCERNCNPSFDRVANLISFETQRTGKTMSLLVPATQTQTQARSNNVVGNVENEVIPPSFEPSLFDESVNIPKVSKKVVNKEAEVIIKASTSVEERKQTKNTLNKRKPDIVIQSKNSTELFASNKTPNNPEVIKTSSSVEKVDKKQSKNTTNKSKPDIVVQSKNSTELFASSKTPTSVNPFLNILSHKSKKRCTNDDNPGISAPSKLQKNADSPPLYTATSDDEGSLQINGQTLNLTTANSQSTVNKDKEVTANKDRESAVNKDRKSAINKDRESTVNKDGETTVNRNSGPRSDPDLANPFTKKFAKSIDDDDDDCKIISEDIKPRGFTKNEDCKKAMKNARIDEMFAVRIPKSKTPVESLFPKPLSEKRKRNTDTPNDTSSDDDNPFLKLLRVSSTKTTDDKPIENSILTRRSANNTSRVFMNPLANSTVNFGNTSRRDTFADEPSVFTSIIKPSSAEKVVNTFKEFDLYESMLASNCFERKTTPIKWINVNEINEQPLPKEISKEQEDYEKSFIGVEQVEISDELVVISKKFKDECTLEKDGLVSFKKFKKVNPIFANRTILTDFTIISMNDEE